MISNIAIFIDRAVRKQVKQLNVVSRDQKWHVCLLIAALTTIIILTVQTMIGLLEPSSEYIYCKPELRYEYLCKQQSLSKSANRTIYAVTPTYDRHVQMADLTRLANTLMLIPNLHWLIIEDSNHKTGYIEDFIRRLDEEFSFHSITHLNTPTPENYKLKIGQPIWTYPRGVWQRNRALEWLINNSDDIDQDGIIYFADDDNTYDLKLFSEMRETRMISVWPVAFVGGLLVEKPIVDKVNRTKVVSFNSMWRKDRPYPIDMAGFAISVRLYFSKKNVKFSAREPIGFVESDFIGKLIDSWDELEPRSNECRDILVWHTKTQKPTLHEERKLIIPSLAKAT